MLFFAALGGGLGFYLGKQLARGITFLLCGDTNPDKWQVSKTVEKSHEFKKTLEGNYTLYLMHEKRNDLGIVPTKFVPSCCTNGKSVKKLYSICDTARKARNGEAGTYRHEYNKNHTSDFSFFANETVVNEAGQLPSSTNNYGY